MTGQGAAHHTLRRRPDQNHRRAVTVPAAGLEGPPNRASGFGRTIRDGSRVRQYCAVIGYVAPQNKFELRLPLPADWNHNYFFAASGGFCGAAPSALRFMSLICDTCAVRSAINLR